MGCFSGSSQESSQTSTRPSQNRLLDALIEKFEPEVDKGPDVFPGETIAPLTALQTGAIEGAQDISGAFTAPQTSAGFGGGPLATQATGAVSGLLSGDLGATPLTAEKFGELFQRSISDPARKTFREETRPAIDEAFAGPGFVSSARSKEIVKQKTDLEDALQAGLSAGQLQNIRQNQALEESRAALYGCREALGDAANISYAIELIEIAFEKVLVKAGLFPDEIPPGRIVLAEFASYSTRGSKKVT